MTEEQIKARAKEQFPNDEFKQQAVIDAINWATKELQEQIEKMKNCKNCANYMISGKCPCFFRTGWCKNWEMTRSKK